jgi:hypothetical protein
MAQCLNLSHWQQNLYDHPISDGLYEKVVQIYLQKLIPMIIVFFTTANVGLRRLQYFCREILLSPTTIKQIKGIIKTAAHNADKYLTEWDKIAGEQTQCLEMDTTWKGRFHKFFGVIAKDIRYLFVLQPIKNEKAAILRPILQQLATICINVKYIITDMAIGFKGLIKKIFSFAIHLFCHVHISRLFYREVGEEREKFGIARHKLQKAKGPVDTTKKWLYKNRKCYNYSQNYLSKIQKWKRHVCHQLGIAVKPNGSIQNKRGGLHPALTKLSLRINRTSANVSRFQKQTEKQRKKLGKTTEKYQKQRSVYNSEWSKAMIPAKIRKLLNKTLHSTRLGQFKRRYNKLKRKLQQSNFKGTKKLLKILSSSPFQHTSKIYLLPESERFSISTNTIEGFFAQCRMLLDEVRNAPDTAHIRSRLTLLRYWHNAIGPLNGFEAYHSPCSRVGIRFGSKNPIQLICSNIRLPLNLSS